MTRKPSLSEWVWAYRFTPLSLHGFRSHPTRGNWFASSAKNVLGATNKIIYQSKVWKYEGDGLGKDWLENNTLLDPYSPVRAEFPFFIPPALSILAFLLPPGNYARITPSDNLHSWVNEIAFGRSFFLRLIPWLLRVPREKKVFNERMRQELVVATTFFFSINSRTLFSIHFPLMHHLQTFLKEESQSTGFQ